MKEYIIENETFTEIYEKVENIYSALAIIKHYCNDNRTSEDISVIYPRIILSKFIFYLNIFNNFSEI